ncbi:universal stress protein [Streptomyces sp. HUAS TT3]|uniref:universal stress protein n=1 Tax=Streptomyces sp. HUAS TT3 TaxID=3447510 RepID=UPI003F66047F
MHDPQRAVAPGRLLEGEGEDPVAPLVDVLTGTARELRRLHPQLDVTAWCPAARPAAALAAEAADAGLLVLGSRGPGGLLGSVVGSVALSTVVATVTPVVLVRGPTTATATAVPETPDALPPGGILVGVDSSVRRQGVTRASPGGRRPWA